jgi:flagellar hook-length control protein FliK
LFRGAAFVASHLTVTTTIAGVSTSKGLSTATAGEAEGGVFDVFAALLGTAAPQPGAQATNTSTSRMDLNLGNLINLSLGFGEQGAGENEDPEAVAALVDAVVPFQEKMEAGPMLTDIADTLASIKTRLEAGEPVDPEMLKRLDAALTELAAALDVDLASLPSLDDLTALVTDIQPDNASFAARLTAAFGPVAETLFSGSAAPQGDAGAELSTLIKSVGDKLAALLSALNSGDIDSEQLARLEIGAAADVDLEAALARLTKSAVAADAAVPAPVLATPELKLTEATLTGKAAGTPETAATTAASGDSTEPAPASAPLKASAADGDATPDRGGESPPQDKKPAETRPTPLAAPVDKQPEPVNPTQPTQAARVDIVAAPRVVQAGYQTSQQQLNLPQLAFELVRQISDGNTRFQIRLDPPELGRIDVKLDIDKAGQVNARLTVEKAETLDLMQRDQRALERALQQAGLDGAKTNLEFSLKQNPFSSGQQGQDGGAGGNPIFGDEAAADADETPPPTVNLYRGNLSASGVNIIA